MKKLLLIGLLFVPSVADAATVVVQPYLSGADVSISSLNNNQNAIVNQINGNLEGGYNIKAGSINSTELAQAISPVTRWRDSFNNYTVSGMLPASDVDLTSDISAGVSYVNGYRLDIAATAHTYTASKDTYVYINEGGYYVFQEVANGGTTPSTPANSLLLAKVVTSGTAITSVTDSRTLSIQITTTTTNFPADFRDQAYVSRDTTTTMHVEPGSVAIANTIYTRTTDTSSKNVTTGSNWIEAGYSPGGPTNIFIYAYNDSGSTWDFKYSSQDPVYSDSSSNSNGVLRYYTTGGTTYRAIGWAWLSGDQVQIYEFGNFKDIGVSNYAYRLGASTITVSNTTYTNPLNSTEINFYTTGGDIQIEGSLYSTASSSNPFWSAAVYSGTGAISNSERTDQMTSGTDPASVDTSYTIKHPQGSYKLGIASRVHAGSADVSREYINIEEK